MIYLILFLPEYDYYNSRSAILSHVSLFGSQVPPTWLSLFGESAARELNKYLPRSQAVELQGPYTLWDVENQLSGIDDYPHIPPVSIALMQAAELPAACLYSSRNGTAKCGGQPKEEIDRIFCDIIERGCC
jgi:hypothetical protein